MRFIKSPMKRATVIVAALVVVATAGTLARRAAARGEASAAAPSPSQPAAPPAGHAVQQPAAPARQLIRVWIHGDDIYPFVVHARPGPIFLRAENETQSDVTLVVEQVVPGQSNQELTRIRTVREGQRAGQELALGVGEYLFYEVSRPEIRGTLLVEPPGQ
jgi:hypothetical protein